MGKVPNLSHLEKTLSVKLSLSFSLKPSSSQAFHQTDSIQAKLKHNKHDQAKNKCREQNQFSYKSCSL